MAKRKKPKFVLPPGVVLPKGLGINLKPKVVTRLVEMLIEEKELNDSQIVARMKSERLKLSQGTVLRFREGMRIPARGMLGPATINRTDELIALGKYTPGQISKILYKEGHKISAVTVRKRMKEKSKTPLVKVLETGDMGAVTSLVRKMNPNQRLNYFRVAAKEREKVKLKISKVKSDGYKYTLARKLERIDLLLKALALFIPANVLEGYIKKYAE